MSKNELSISGTVTFNLNSKDRWQTIYSSVLYDTFFQIYAKFNFDENSNTLKEVEFRLENYKGKIDLGLVKAEFIENKERVKVYDPPFGDKIIRVLSFVIEIKALETNDRLKITPNYTLLTSDKNSIYIEIDRKLLTLAKKGINFGPPGFFDTEFYYRDGTRVPYTFKEAYLDFRSGQKLNPQVNINEELINDKGELIDLLGRRVDGQKRLIDTNGNLILDPNGNPTFGDFNMGIKSPGAVCPKGYSKIVF